MSLAATLTGNSLIGAMYVRGQEASFSAVNPATDQPFPPEYAGAGAAEVERACHVASHAFQTYRATGRNERAAFLERIAQNILELGDELVVRATQETGLPRGRIEGERGRTVSQLRLFADVVREGSWLGVRLDPELPERQPLPRPDLRLRNIPLGPVAVFGASNFPLAFSVAGGDTASALAAGCPVVVKAHPAHPGTSELVGQAIRAAVAQCHLPEGVFSLLFGIGNELGSALVSDPRIKAIGFTGSRAGGLALVALAARRKEPIPVYAEMSSINPVILLPGALSSRGYELGKGFVGSLMLGAGQFCTNPGLVLAVAGSGLNEFHASAKQSMEATPAGTMLHRGIFKAYESSIARITSMESVATLARGQNPTASNQCQGALFDITAEQFLNDGRFSEEVFGASSLIVTCADMNDLRTVLQRLEGQLTIGLQMEPVDTPLARTLLPLLEEKAGRILINGWPTGVEVSHAMVHGGPFPSTSDSRTTSVGTLAIHRFLRPVCYQNFPDELLPNELRKGVLETLPRFVEGKPINVAQ